MELNGAEIVVRCLQEEGVDYVFGYPGGAVLHLYDELYINTRYLLITNNAKKSCIHSSVRIRSSIKLRFLK